MASTASAQLENSWVAARARAVTSASLSFRFFNLTFRVREDQQDEAADHHDSQHGDDGDDSSKITSLFRGRRERAKGEEEARRTDDHDRAAYQHDAQEDLAELRIDPVHEDTTVRTLNSATRRIRRRPSSSASSYARHSISRSSSYS